MAVYKAEQIIKEENKSDLDGVLEAGVGRGDGGDGGGIETPGVGLAAAPVDTGRGSAQGPVTKEAG